MYNLESGWVNIIFWLCVVALLCIGIPVHINNTTNNHNLNFDEYIHKYNKSYKSGTPQYNHRLNIFKESLREIEKLNRGTLRACPECKDDGELARYGLTKFSDLTKEEFVDLYLQPPQNKTLKTQLKSKQVTRLPRRVDWRDAGVVSSINDQEGCGACWAFSTVQAVESMVAINSGKLYKLSTQQVLDCTPTSYNAYGCDGGDPCSTLDYLSRSKTRIVKESAYQLTLQDQACRLPHASHGAVVRDYACYNLVNYEIYIKYLLATHGPLTVAIDATTWQHYLGGIIRYHCRDNANHAVNIVGYDTTGRTPYYIVRNTWNTDFGLQGYLYIAMGHNVCGLAEEVSMLNAYMK